MSRPSVSNAPDAAQQTLDAIADGVIRIDVAGKVTYLNPAAERMTGWSQREARGRSHQEVLRIVDGNSREPALNPLTLAILHNKTATLSANSVLIRRDGKETAVEDTAAPIRDRDGAVCGAVIVFHDVAAARAHTLEMTYTAQHDALTDLPNRLLFGERLTHAMSMAHRRHALLALMYLDVDRFKQVNDSLGHAIGDQLLQSIAQRLKGCVRDSDIVCRLGGDEFVILLSEVAHATDAAVSADKIRRAVGKLHCIEDRDLRVTVSIGIGVYPVDATDGDTLLRHADLAMLEAKARGRARHQFFEPRMSEQRDALNMS